MCFLYVLDFQILIGMINGNDLGLNIGLHIFKVWPVSPQFGDIGVELEKLIFSHWRHDIVKVSFDTVVYK